MKTMKFLNLFTEQKIREFRRKTWDRGEKVLNENFSKGKEIKAEAKLDFYKIMFQSEVHNPENVGRSWPGRIGEHCQGWSQGDHGKGYWRG